MPVRRRRRMRVTPRTESVGGDLFWICDCNHLRTKAEKKEKEREKEKEKEKEGSCDIRPEIDIKDSGDCGE